MTLSPRLLINTAGLRAVEVANGLVGFPHEHLPRQYYAKGHYFELSRRSSFSHLVYPVPGDGGLGVHVTLDLAGRARFGPDVQWIEKPDYTFDESRREAFAKAIREYFPSLDDEALQPGYTGIRPKLVGEGAPAADFMISMPDEHGVAGVVNLFGIESPGLTASMAIADCVAARLDA